MAPRSGQLLRHLSLYPFAVWFVGTAANSLIYTWLFNSTGGSLFAVAAFHILGNTYGALVTGVSIAAMAIVSCAVAAALVVIFGKEDLSRSRRVSAG